MTLMLVREAAVVLAVHEPTGPHWTLPTVADWSVAQLTVIEF